MNYRIAFKLTGETVPPVAGYYRPINSEETIFQRCGGSDMFVFISPVAPNTCYIGESFDEGTALFMADAISGDWEPVDSATGTPVYSEYTIGEAWELAERTVFESLAGFLGSEEDSDCYRGMLPMDEAGDPVAVNRWFIATGGSGEGFDPHRLSGTNGAWCNLIVSGYIEGLFEERTSALQFIGSVFAWLKSTANVHQQVNVESAFIQSLPEEPKATIVRNCILWSVRVRLNIMFLTESAYGD